MPATWSELAAKLGVQTSPFHPRDAILLGAIYTRQQYDQFTAERTELDRKRFALAAYNCGLGCVLDAQRRASGATSYIVVKPYLPHETQEYNRLIIYWRQAMIDDGHTL